MASTVQIIRRAAEIELGLCLLANRSCDRVGVQRFFRTVSRLGDGVFWYVLMLLLPAVHGEAGANVSLKMGLVGLFGLGVYKATKELATRERPYAVSPAIHLGTAPLDHYSFPSGHTLHAVEFSMVVLAHYPELSWLLVPFTFLVAASRVILGLHYLTDVIAGAAIGAIVAALGLSYL